MDVIYTPDHQRHNPPFEHYDGVAAPYAETAARAEAIIDRLRGDQRFTVRRPTQRSVRRNIEQVHHPAYVSFLERRSGQLDENEILYPSYFITDTYAPITAHTYRVAVDAVRTALTAADIVLRGKRSAYALCRPPGHHAEHVSMGGYCYFNNAAIAADYLSQHGRVVILDIDFHHGNGTQASFYDRSDVLYVSIHADPLVRYPYISGFHEERGRGDGLGYNRNYPLALGTDDATYMRALRRALRDVRQFQPDYLIVSAGFDTYVHDPIGGFALNIPVYREMGEAIAALHLPAVILQEGGYNVEALGEMAYQFLLPFTESQPVD